MDWNSRYEKEDIPWEKGSHAPPLEEIARKLGDAFWAKRSVLVPGCGFGHDARWLARHGAEVTGLDVSGLAIEGAQARTEGENPTFQVGDFFKPESARYSVVFEHTCFCAIDPSDRATYASAVRRWLTPGGYLVAIFFLNPDHKGGPPFGCTLEELDHLFGADFEVEAEWEPQLTYPGREGREWIRILRKRDAP